MTRTPEVQVVQIDYGPLALAASLNRAIARDSPLLKATLDVRWDEADAATQLHRIETALAAFSPSFREHQCRGSRVYRVFPKEELALAGAGGARGAAEDARPQPFDAGLALAHLIEHAVIDFESAITRATRISGVTAARRSPAGRFDLLVECPDPAVGRLCLALAVLSLTGAADARPPGRSERDLLATARMAYRHPERVFTPPGVARAFAWPIEQADAALSSLRQLGYLAPLASTVNISGVPRYTVTRT